jgi:hypothetical protein
LFWLRRSLCDLPPADRALAVRDIYSKLRELWGDTDRVGAYSIEEALGTTGMHRLWLSAYRVVAMANHKHRARARGRWRGLDRSHSGSRRRSTGTAHAMSGVSW